jgi:hypothetical protein
MDPGKRAWIWSGLSMARGVGLVSLSVAKPEGPRPRPKLAPGVRVVLGGGPLAQGLSPPLRQLAGESSVVLRTRADDRARASDWSACETDLAALNPDLVLVALELADLTTAAAPALASLVKALRRKSVPVVWVAPPSEADPKPRRAARPDIFPSEALEIPRGPDAAPTAIGFAGWAGAIWRWLS